MLFIQMFEGEYHFSREVIVYVLIFFFLIDKVLSDFFLNLLILRKWK